ncbi:MAG: hypothetical protein R2748_12835 [Bryobacterales bacterium]
MSVECVAVENGFVIRGIEGYPYDVLLEVARPGWSASLIGESGPASRDSALTRTRAVERLLRQSLTDAAQLEAAMNEVNRSLEKYPE